MYNTGKLVVAGALFILGAASHKEEHVLEKGEYRDTTWLKLIVSYTHFLVVMNLAFAVAVGWVLGVEPLSGPWTMAEAASAVVAFGALALRRWAVITLQHYFTFAVGLRKDHKLIRSGPYAWMRHPAYTGTILFHCAAYYFLGYRVPILWLPILAIIVYVIRIRMANEEQVLLEAFGKECEEHFKSTWRLIPFIY